MKSWRRTLLICIVFAGLNGSACSVVALERATPSLPSVSVPTATILPTLPAPTSTAVVQLDSSCWPVKPLQKENDIKGSFVYANYAAHTTETNNFFAWDIGAFRSLALDVEPSLRVGDESYVSPDGKYIAALFGKDIVLISPNNIRSFLLPHDGVVIRAYLSDGRILLVDIQNRDDTYREGTGLTDIFYILNPDTGEITKHSVFLPNLEQELHHTFVIQYSPDMAYVLYKSLSEKKDAGPTFTLYSLEKNEVVWVGPAHEPNLGNVTWTVPAWRPDASELTGIYIDENGSNYYSISLDGKISPLTNFNGATLITTASSSWWSDTAEFPNWSPNGRYLVSSGYQKNDVRNLNSFMYIWDNQEKAAYKPCLPNEEHRLSTPYRWIHWSSDGFYFEVTLTFAPPTDASSSEYISKNYILDLANKTIFEIPDDSNRGEFIPLLYKKGFTAFLGWVNWEIP